MHYTSGTTGKPKGVRRKLSGVPPDAAAGGSQYFLGMFGVGPGDDNVHICGSPLYHTAVLAFVGASLHRGHPVVLMDRWTPESMLELIDRYQVTSSHMVPTQFHRLLALPEEVKARYDVSSPTGPTASPPSDRASSRWSRRIRGPMKAGSLWPLRLTGQSLA